MPIAATVAFGPAGLLTAPAGFSLFFLGVMEYQLGVHHIKEVVSGECDNPEKVDPCSHEPIVGW